MYRISVDSKKIDAIPSKEFSNFNEAFAYKLKAIEVIFDGFVSQNFIEVRFDATLATDKRWKKFYARLDDYLDEKCNCFRVPYSVLKSACEEFVTLEAVEER